MLFDSSLLKGRSALVTGGGTGICRGIALALAAHGCDVAIMSRRREHLEATLQDLVATGVRAHAVVGDVRDPSAAENAVGETVRALGHLNILVNGAAGNFVCLAEHLSPNGFGTVVDIDVKGTFHMSKAALPHLKSQGGTIINISATVQNLGTIGQVHAAAAKAGVDAITRTLAVEWGPLGIRVNGIAPGPTGGTEGVDRLTSGAQRERAIGNCPLGRLATISDSANAALFLCSDAAAFINGVTLVVDGALGLRSSRMVTDQSESVAAGARQS